MKEVYIYIIIFKFHLMSIHVIAQGIVSIRSFSFRKEAEIKKLFLKNSVLAVRYLQVGYYTLALRQNVACIL